MVKVNASYCGSESRAKTETFGFMLLTGGTQSGSHKAEWTHTVKVKLG